MKIYLAGYISRNKIKKKDLPGYSIKDWDMVRVFFNNVGFAVKDAMKAIFEMNGFIQEENKKEIKCK